MACVAACRPIHIARRYFAAPQSGVKFDPESAQILRLEFARSNTKMTRPRQLFPAALAAAAAAAPIQQVLSPATPAYIHPFTTRK